MLAIIENGELKLSQALCATHKPLTDSRLEKGIQHFAVHQLTLTI